MRTSAAPPKYNKKNATSDQTNPRMVADFMPARTLSGFPAPVFWLVKVTRMEKEKILRAAVCAAMISVPRELIPLCRIMDPISTIEYMRAIPAPEVRRSVTVFPFHLKCSGLICIYGIFRMTQTRQTITEMSWAMTVEMLAPRMPSPSPLMQNRSSPRFKVEEIASAISGKTLSPRARSILLIRL